MPVLIAVPVLTRPGGVAQYFRTLRAHLGENCTYFAVGSRADNESLMRVLLRSAVDCIRFALLITRGGYDIVHLNPSIVPKALLREGLLLLVAKLLRRRVVVFMHGWDDACERMIRRWFMPLFRAVYFRADCFIVLSSDYRDRLRKLGYGGTILLEVVPVEDEILKEAHWRRAIADRPFRLLFLARVERAKGIYETLDAYTILKRRHPFVTLTVAGDGSELARCRAYAASRGIAGVEFAGHLEADSKREAFRTANVYILPSYSEGLPISVIEAMAYGLPVVTRAVGGLRDMFLDGQMGFMTESLDPSVLAELLDRIVSDPDLAARMAAFNREYAGRRFTAAGIAARLSHVHGAMASRSIAAA